MISSHVEIPAPIASMLRLMFISAFVYSGAACSGNSDPSARPYPQQRELTVEVRNYNFYDATIYAWDAGERLRLGMAQGKSTTTFNFRWDLGNVRFVIDFIGAGEIVGEVLPVDPGDDLILIVGQEDHRRSGRSMDDLLARSGGVEEAALAFWQRSLLLRIGA